MADEFIITGWFDYGANRDRVLAPFVECAQRSRAEPGCLDYWVAADSEDPGRLYVFERWESEQHLADHFTTAHVEAFRSAVEAYPRTARDLHRYFVARSEEFSSSRPAVS